MAKTYWVRTETGNRSTLQTTSSKSKALALRKGKTTKETLKSKGIKGITQTLITHEGVNGTSKRKPTSRRKG